jgi:hypothetical protein
MIFTWIFGVIGTVYSILYAAGAPTATDFFAGFIAGALIDIYGLLKKGK